MGRIVARPKKAQLSLVPNFNEGANQQLNMITNPPLADVEKGNFEERLIAAL